MSIKITSDSTCDLPEELLERFDITLLPLYVSVGEDTYRDGVDIQPADLFAYVERRGTLPSTAAVNVADYAKCFAEFSAEREAVIHITISSEFSSCYQNACIAAEEFDNVYVVDSRNLSCGHGLVVVEAALAAQRGMAAPEIVELLHDLTGRVEASFLLERLDYMVKGGRCSMVAALGANLLKLKPCIEVVDGKMKVVKKYRGAYQKVFQEYVRDRLSGREDICHDRIFIAHTEGSHAELEVLRGAVAEYGKFAETYETVAGCTISCHCGPHTAGILFIRDK